MTYQIEAYSMLVHTDTLKFQNSSKILGKKPVNNLHLHYIAESHAADRPLPGEWKLKGEKKVDKVGALFVSKPNTSHFGHLNTTKMDETLRD